MTEDTARKASKKTKTAKISHMHDWQPPVLHEDGENYVIKCLNCPAKIKITKKQFEQGGY